MPHLFAQARAHGAHWVGVVSSNPVWRSEPLEHLPRRMSEVGDVPLVVEAGVAGVRRLAQGKPCTEQKPPICRGFCLLRVQPAGMSEARVQTALTLYQGLPAPCTRICAKLKWTPPCCTVSPINRATSRGRRICMSRQGMPSKGGAQMTKVQVIVRSAVPLGMVDVR